MAANPPFEFNNDRTRDEPWFCRRKEEFSTTIMERIPTVEQSYKRTSVENQRQLRGSGRSSVDLRARSPVPESKMPMNVGAG